MELLKAQVGALKAELKTLQEQQEMNWLKRKIENFIAAMPEAHYDYLSPFGFGGMV